MQKPLDAAEYRRAERTVISTEAAHQRGVSDHEIAKFVECGVWRRVYRGVYVSHGEPATTAEKLRAALVAAGPHCHFAGAGAAWLHRLDGFKEPALELVVRRARRRHDYPPGLIVRSTRRLDAGDCTRLFGLRCTKLARTVVDLFEGDHPWRTLVCAYEDLCRRGRGHRRALAACIDRFRSGLKGINRLEALIRRRGLDAPPTGSAAEAIADDMLFRDGLVAERQVSFSDDDGFIGRVDFLFRSEKLILEVDSREWHGSEEAYYRDGTRALRLEKLGFHVARIRWPELQSEPHFLSTVRDLLRIRARFLQKPYGPPLREQLPFAFEPNGHDNGCALLRCG